MLIKSLIEIKEISKNITDMTVDKYLIKLLSISIKKPNNKQIVINFALQYSYSELLTLK